MSSLHCVILTTLLIASTALEPLCNESEAHRQCRPMQRAHGSSLLQVASIRSKTQLSQAQPVLKEDVPSVSSPLRFTPRVVQQALASLDISVRGMTGGNLTLEITTMVLLLVLVSAALYLWIEKRFGGEDAQRDEAEVPASSMASSYFRETLAIHDIWSLMGEEVQSVPCDCMMVLCAAEPVEHSTSAGSVQSNKSSVLETTSTAVGIVRRSLLRQPQVVPGLAMAKTVFLDPLRHSFKCEEDLQKRFSEEMTFESYASEARKLLEEMLTSSSFGFELEPFRTAEKDKLCWRLRLPPGDAVCQYAAHYHYRMSLNDTVYERLQVDVPRNNDGDKVYAFLPYMPKWADIFKKFHQGDRLKLMLMRIDRHVNLHALKKQNVLVQFFAAHSLEHVNLLCKKWANIRRFYRFPKFAHMELVKNYFGESIGFMFLWQRYYMSGLLVPAILGGLVFWRRFVLPAHMHDRVQIGFAMVMALWAPIFNARYARFEARTRQRWGMQADHAAIHVRAAYKAERDGTWQVMIAPVLGDVLSAGMVILSVLGIQVIQTNRSSQRHIKFWHGVFVALQILSLDWLWQITSKKITNMENHRLTNAWWDSWIRKMLPVRMFTNLYPFIFVGFLKQYTAEGCPKTQTGCIDELQSDLCIYFAMTITKDIARDTLLIAFAYCKLAWGRIWRRRNGDSESQYMFLQVQAQMVSYDDWLFMDDWTRQVTTFLLLVCFNVVLPAIGVFVLLTTMFEARLLAHRTCCHLQRPLPVGAPGIGAWQSVLEIMEVIGVLVSVSFAIFVMHPLAEKPLWDKFCLFLISEHVLLVLNLFVKGKYPRTPHDVQDIAEFNDSLVNRHFIDVSAHGIHIEAKDGPGTMHEE